MLTSDIICRLEQTLDEKNRLTLPARFRSRFAEGAMLTCGVEGCLDAYPPDEWQTLSTELKRKSQFSLDGRTMRRFLGSGSWVVPDKQGRVLVPQPLISELGLGREVIVTGAIDHLEIWDKAAWPAQSREMKEKVKDASERLATEHD